MEGSVHYAGYEGVAGRTRPCLRARGRRDRCAARTGPADSSPRTTRSSARCVPGTPGRAHCSTAWSRTGESLPPVPLAYGIGLGVEPPIVDDRAVHLDAPLTAGMVLVVQGYVGEPGVGGYFGADTVHVTDDGPERLTKLSHAPFDAP